MRSRLEASAYNRCLSLQCVSVPLLLLSSLVMYEQLLEETAVLPAAGRECQCHKINVGAAQEQIEIR